MPDAAQQILPVVVAGMSAMWQKQMAARVPSIVCHAQYNDAAILLRGN
jgi:hypothetical protein